VLEIKKWLIAIAEENEFALNPSARQHVFIVCSPSAARMSSSRRTSTCESLQHKASVLEQKHTIVVSPIAWKIA